MLPRPSFGQLYHSIEGKKHIVCPTTIFFCFLPGAIIQVLFILGCRLEVWCGGIGIEHRSFTSSPLASVHSLGVVFFLRSICLTHRNPNRHQLADLHTHVHTKPQWYSHHDRYACPPHILFAPFRMYHPVLAGLHELSAFSRGKIMRCSGCSAYRNSLSLWAYSA